MRTCESCAYSMTNGHRIYECINPDAHRYGETVGKPTLRVISQFIAPSIEIIWSLPCGHYKGA